MAADAIVVGAGVMGLSTAICLAERGLDVEVRCDRDLTETASAAASAMVGPVIGPPDSEVVAWGHVSSERFQALAGEEGTGVTIRRGRLAGRDSGGAPPGDFEPCDEDDIPPGFGGAVWANLPVVDMVPYLRYLVRRLEAAGGRVEQRPVAALDEVAAEAELIVNCSGLGARELAGDASMSPIFGQHVIVENPGLEEFFLEAPFTPEWVAFWPYPDHVVIGGASRPGDDSTEPDLELADRMLRNSAAVEPRLGGVRVLRHQVGIRPGRPQPRLEVETIGGAACLHNYGNGSSGVTHSWGAAEAGVTLLLAEG